MPDMPAMNIFRILADLSHTASKCILIWAIHRNKSSEGVSLLTQLLYIVVFCTRYSDLFWVEAGWSMWNHVLKIFYICSSLYIVYIMMRVFARTREREYAWKLAGWSLAACLLSAPFVQILFLGLKRTSFFDVIWTFSIELESVCVLPQLLLLRQTTVPTVLDSFYLVTLGSYRFLYLLNWIVRIATEKNFYEPISTIFGAIQTLLYLDFAWVYWTRQRVKLRGGGLVDGDDLSKSFLVRRFIGRPQANEDAADAEDAALEGQENGTIHAPVPRSGRSWGVRGISVSADDTLPADGQDGRDTHDIADPAQFEDDDFDDDADAPLPPAKDSEPAHAPSTPSPKSELDDASAQEGGNSATEWQSNAGK